MVDVRLIHGSARSIPLEDESVQTVVTSPPYWGLRQYAGEQREWWDVKEIQPEHRHVAGAAIPGSNRGGSGTTTDKNNRCEGYGRNAERGAFCYCGAWYGALGLEPTPELYVEHIVAIFREVRRVLRKDGSLWLNLGDSYAGNRGNTAEKPGWDNKSAGQGADLAIGISKLAPGLKPKDLVGIPWMVAFALRADGWYLRSDIIWHKPNPMPESVTDRPTKAHEYLFLLTKSAKYFYDSDAVREPSSEEMQSLRARSSGNGVLSASQPIRTGDGLQGLREGAREGVATDVIWPRERERSGDSIRADGAWPETQGGVSAGAGEQGAPARLPKDGDSAYGFQSTFGNAQTSDNSRNGNGQRMAGDSAAASESVLLLQGEDEADDGSSSSAQSRRASRGNEHRASVPVMQLKEEGSPVASRPTRNLRTVWTIPTRPYKGAHFATFPPDLVEPCVLAGSSPKACGVCGAPWERVTERERHKISDSKRYTGNGDRNDSEDGRWESSSVTTGWRSTCEHEDDSGACVVLDPFNGSGTTGRVAVRLGRSYVGVDISKEYLDEQAVRRIYDVQMEAAL